MNAFKIKNHLPLFFYNFCCCAISVWLAAAVKNIVGEISFEVKIRIKIYKYKEKTHPHKRHKSLAVTISANQETSIKKIHVMGKKCSLSQEVVYSFPQLCKRELHNHDFKYNIHDHTKQD